MTSQTKSQGRPVLARATRRPARGCAALLACAALGMPSACGSDSAGPGMGASSAVTPSASGTSVTPTGAEAPSGMVSSTGTNPTNGGPPAGGGGNDGIGPDPTAPGIGPTAPTPTDSGAAMPSSSGGALSVGGGGSPPGGFAGSGAGDSGTQSGGAPTMGGAGGETAAGGGGTANGGTGGTAEASMEWLPSWATTIQTTEPSNAPPALGNNTLRQFVWPTVSGEEIRIQLSNEKGTAPVEIQQVHIAMAATSDDPGNGGGQIETGTDTAFLFAGMPNVTIPAGETVWSDALAFPLEEITLTAVTMQFGGGVPNDITGHPGARTTSYVVDGDAVGQQDMPGAETHDRWYFINAIEVMAPADALAIAVLGDSITDGYGVLNAFGRWPDFMTLAIQDDAQISDTRSVLNFGMGANNLTSSSEYQDAGRLRFERDVLPRDKIKWLIVFEAVNDINGGVQAQPIIDAYSEIIQLSHDDGILVYGATITPNGSAGVRAEVNEWIRTSGEFDEVIDFDEAIRDPNDQNQILQMYNNDGLHPNQTGYERLGTFVDLSLFYDDTL